MRCSECRDRLDAHVHAELSPTETEALRTHVAECPECAAELAQRSAMSRRLKEGLVRYPAPDVLRARIRSAIARSASAAEPAPTVAPHRRWARLLAAGLVIAVASSATTATVLRRGAQSRAVADELLASHVRSLMPGHLTDIVSTDQHNVKPWFNGRVDLSPSTPRLDSAGFPLVGGRIDYVSSRPVAVVVYTRRQHVINVYAWPSTGDDEAVRLATSNGYHFLHWRSGQVESWAVSDLNASELAEFVALFRRGAG